MGNETDYNTFRLAYSEIAGMRPVGRAQSVQAEIVKRMEAMLANSPLPASVNNARKVASDFTKLGGKAFEGKVVGDLLKSDFGQERLYKNIIGAGKPTYFRAFQKSLE
jgi:ABC-type Fe2+-enterobactin transport system substrate-binding protein